MIKWTFAIALLFIACLACAEGPEEIRMGTEGGYPPYNFINDSGEVDGFERELGDELCRRVDLECVWVTNEWDSMIPNLVEGKYDTILAGMSITDERDEVIDFTQPYTPSHPVSLYRSVRVRRRGGRRQSGRPGGHHPCRPPFRVRRDAR